MESFPILEPSSSLLISRFPLFIVVPAFKRRFLKRTLDSFARQSDQRFELVVVDDGSPEDLQGIVADYSNYRCVRFVENWGRENIVRSWNRAMSIVRSQWVWFFSDDDIADANCVQRFYEDLELTGGRFDLYRFNTFMVDGEDNVVRKNHPHPQVEYVDDFLYFRFRELRESYLSEYIFRYSTFAHDGTGFIDFPLGTNSDDATWITVGRNTGIWTIADAFVYWRQSSSNISVKRDRRSCRSKLEANFSFFQWTEEHMALSPMVREERQRWIVKQVLWRYDFDIRDLSFLSNKLSTVTGRSGWLAWLICAGIVIGRSLLRRGRRLVGRLESIS